MCLLFDVAFIQLFRLVSLPKCHWIFARKRRTLRLLPNNFASSSFLFFPFFHLFIFSDFFFICLTWLLRSGGFNMSTLRLSYYFDGWHELSSALLPSFGWKLNAERQWMERSMPTDWPYLKLIATQYSIIEYLFSFFVPWRWLDSDKDKCTYSLQWEKMICTLRVEQWPKRERERNHFLPFLDGSFYPNNVCIFWNISHISIDSSASITELNSFLLWTH